ncbi:MAG: signal peptide peptidase SppA [Rickettsiales bacterium]|nr:MAG: signal peptide peptidase SppA [Rickettsiales bacterium]
MNISPDYLIERKRSKKQLSNWKIIALILLAALLFSSFGKLPASKNFAAGGFQSKDYIASVQIENVIEEDNLRIRKFESIEKDDSIKALIVNINSPGGSVVGSEKIYNVLRKISKTKPVVVIMGSVAASGGYLASLGGDYIIAHNGTLTGSIGVIMQSAEVTKLAEMVGVKFENFKSGELKASPNPTEETSPEARQATMDSIYEVYDYFVELVAARRNLDVEYVKKIADGRVYSGRQALDLKLVDAIGDEDSAVKWLQEEKGIPFGAEVVDVKIRPRDKLIEILLEDLQGCVSGFFSALGSKSFKSVI